MEYEIELKLITDKTAGEVIHHKLLPELNVEVKHDSLILTNHYFDSKDRILRKNDIGLRIRGNNQRFEQTLKTAGKSIGGLHQRPEYNVELNSQTDAQQSSSQQFPKLALFPKTAWPDNINPFELEPNLEVLFTTHFKRERYLITLTSDDSVELVWDLGEIRSGDKTLEICEIELELKKGSASVLFDLAKRLVHFLPTSIGIDSKAARGYSLLDDHRIEEPDQNNTQLSKNQSLNLNEYQQLLENHLRRFQQILSSVLLKFSAQNAIECKNALSCLTAHVASFAEKFPCKAMQQNKKQLERLLASWPIKTESNTASELTHFLTSAAATELQLEILQTLVEQPWLTKNNSF